MARQLRPRSTDKETSRYTQGGATVRFPRRLGWWERRTINQRDDDLFITVNARQAKRPDLIAFDYFRNSDLAWLVLQYNNIVDDNVELLEGAEIRLPAPQRVLLSILTNSTGGVPAPR
jgi:hypothetical protein